MDYEMAFEAPFGGLLTGTAEITVKDPAGITPPSTIIQTDDAWQVEVKWEIDGAIAPFIGGEWEVSVFVEAIGPGEEKQVGTTKNVPLSNAAPLPLPRQYTTAVDVPAFDPNAGVGLDKGAYRLVTLVNFKHLGVPLEMAAFVEGPILQVYEPKP
jgi:hypothetical protein